MLEIMLKKEEKEI